jgi:hypothetical protein
MKKIVTTWFIVLCGLFMIPTAQAEQTPVDLLPASCIAYNDWCNNCARTDSGSQWACTEMACDIATTYVPVCTKYARWEEPTMCTMDYNPVCGSVQVECVTTPCEPVEQTFGNACSMAANPRATFLHRWECKADREPIKACTKEYMPHCGKVDWEIKTFGNKCMLEADEATMLYVGECKAWLLAWEGSMYNAVANILDKSYLAWEYTPVQAYNYTQWLVDKMQTKLETSRMKKRAHERATKLKRFLEIYMQMSQLK